MTDVDPLHCSKRDVARFFGEDLKTVDKWVREGCPCEPSGKGPRAPLVVNMPKVWRWRFIKESYRHSPHAGQLAEQEVKIMDLEYEIGILKGEIDSAFDFRKA
jgi:phage terminase Nu1 subunit (DNA packaging protein)